MKYFMYIPLLLLGLSTWAVPNDLDKSLSDEFAHNNGTKIHYVAKGQGDLIVFIHGFPDFWYSWRNQLNSLSKDFRVVAVDTRGYNKSDKPKEQSQYHMSVLVEDIKTVISHEKRAKAIIVGHDWGGMIAWHFATQYPTMTDKLIILNLPYPKNLSRELTHNPIQQKNAAYARRFQESDSHKVISAEALAAVAARGDLGLSKIYAKAFNRSSLEAMMFYYRENFPKVPYVDIDFPKISMPVLQFHGLEDTALHSDGLTGTWNEVLKDYTLVTLSDSGHWPHLDAPEKINETIRWWVKMRQD